MQFVLFTDNKLSSFGRVQEICQMFDYHSSNSKSSDSVPWVFTKCNLI